MGTTRSFCHIISEPEPGRVLVETDADGYSVTTFTVEPQDGATRLTIETEFNTRSGLAGRIERFFTSAVLRRIYADELSLITDYMLEIGEMGLKDGISPRSGP
jgi:hypothetical protein